MKRVVVTGLQAITPIGDSWQTVSENLRAGNTGIRYMQDWDQYQGLNTRLGGPANFDTPGHYNRKTLRSMGRIAVMATYATELALAQAGLLDDPDIKTGSMGVAYGSSSGSTNAFVDFGRMLIEKDTGGLNANSYIKMMAHTAPVNVGVHFGLKGRVYTTSSACTSGSQGIGYAFEAVRSGQQRYMVAGGAEELCATQAAVFDTLFATSVKNATPHLSPRPFDRDRDGLVIGEGAGTLILEDLASAQARGAKIYAEVVGFGTNSDGTHVTQPNSDTMEIAMRLALDNAGLKPQDIGYISAHGTATDRGDIAESHATFRVFGDQVPISSMKSFTGHTLGACGGIEAWAAIQQMNENWFHHTQNLDNPDPECAPLDYIQASARQKQCEYVMSNNFAFGGINTSLIFKRWV
ncbi:beta-ketoacyl-ACP synthase [Simiduia curdlanivorans]|uniref:Beta-ketoacyl-ACP synthase n=1 Tax=Simiduia curdlanivorans TaxID=1492769 RepID=A0ABV8V5H3_9GAMM|nr:beta-ketoacyl-ACP synthase [Simiduia curdlanivorans]MDN3640791.1 beta-ketoacyl-ACP synthase [Simiduia curdlanivorans]